LPIEAFKFKSDVSLEDFFMGKFPLKMLLFFVGGERDNLYIFTGYKVKFTLIGGGNKKGSPGGKGLCPFPPDPLTPNQAASGLKAKSKA